MRMNGHKSRTTILLGLLAVAVGLFGLSRMEPQWFSGSGAARLVSIAELPDTGDACERVPVSTSSSQSLFADFEETSVHAQDSGGTIDVNRPPVRDIVDTNPIYS